MVAGSEDRIYAYRPVKVLPCTSDVSKIILCDTAEKECPVVCSIQLCQDIEVLNRLGIFSIGKSTSATVVEHVLVILCIQVTHASHEQHAYHNKTS